MRETRWILLVVKSDESLPTVFVPNLINSLLVQFPPLFVELSKHRLSFDDMTSEIVCVTLTAMQPTPSPMSVQSWRVAMMNTRNSIQ